MEKGRKIVEGMLRHFAMFERKRLMAPNVVRNLDVSWVIGEGMLESEGPEHLKSNARINEEKMEFANQKAILWHRPKTT